MHRESPGEAIEGRETLVALVKGATTRDERRAGLWCLAQLDDPLAFDDVRRFARRDLDRPRASLFQGAR